MRAFIKTLVKKAPIPIVELGQVVYDLMPPSWRYGKIYTESEDFLQESENWSLRQLIEYQNEKLQQLIVHAYENVPYYREVFQRNKLVPADIKTVYDLPKIPILTKGDVIQRRNDLLAANVSPFERDPAHTGGSSGTPLDFYMDKSTRPMDRALVQRHLRRLGYKKGDRTAYFKGLTLKNPKKLWQYMPGSKELQITFNRVDEHSLSKIADKMIEFKPAFINGWPSCLSIFAKYLERSGKRLPPPKFVMTSSENMYPDTKKFIEEVFGARTIDWYGQEETVAVAVQCEYALGYHVQMEMAVMEMIPCEDNLHEIIGTCLHNKAMPLIRYKTGDLAVKSDGTDPCPCGMSHPTIGGIVGRDGDMVVTPERSVVSPLILHFAIYYLPEIKAAQLIQEEIDELRVLLVPWTTISDKTKSVLTTELRRRLGAGIQLTFEEADDIPATGNCNKRPFVISHLNPSDYMEAKN